MVNQITSLLFLKRFNGFLSTSRTNNQSPWGSPFLICPGARPFAMSLCSALLSEHGHVTCLGQWNVAERMDMLALGLDFMRRYVFGAASLCFWHCLEKFTPGPALPVPGGWDATLTYAPHPCLAWDRSPSWCWSTAASPQTREEASPRRPARPAKQHSQDHPSSAEPQALERNKWV